MKLVYKFKIKENKGLSQLCLFSNNLYNQANYIIKKELNNNHKWIRYNQLYKIMKEVKTLEGEINFYKLKTQTSQQILKLLDKNWTSYFRSIKDYKQNPSKYKGMPQSPRFKKSGDRNILLYTNQNCKIKNNFLHLSKDIIIHIPEYKNKNFTKFNQVRILPKRNGFEVEIVYSQDIVNSELDTSKYASIDLGLNNLATMISTETKPIIFNGKIIKSYNQWYNKRKAKLCSIKDKMKIKSYTNQLNKMEEDRENLINDYLHKVSKGIVNYCIENKIATLIIGHNKQWKDSIELGKKTNQKFVNIPHSRLISYLKYKSELVGIDFIETEESYTSKIDHLSFEEMKHHENYLGKRVKRGLFQSSIDKVLNADVNGALGILRKVVDDSVVKQIIDSGLLFNPVKIRNMFSISLQNFNKNLLSF
jgi:IS605 OrfB family transposase